MKKKGVLLINLGTPDSPRPYDVFRYLNQFLTDKNIIDLPFLARQLLVRGVIVPKRFKSSAKSYQKIWTEEGSPLLVYTQQVQHLLQESLGQEYVVEIGMRYQNPSIKKALYTLQQASLHELVIIPLFPQYAAATTGSICQELFSSLKRWQLVPQIRIIREFYHHPRFVNAFCALAKNYLLTSYDHVLMSFHGLPEKALKKEDPYGLCLTNTTCCHCVHAKNSHCYSAQCYATAHALASKLHLLPSQYTICFQSRLGKDPWMTPFTSDLMHSLPKKGYKKVLVMCPSFVSDCLETLYEIGIEYREEFIRCGGTELTLMEGLNTHPLWIQTLKELVLTI